MYTKRVKFAKKVRFRATSFEQKVHFKKLFFAVFECILCVFLFLVRMSKVRINAYSDYRSLTADVKFVQCKTDTHIANRKTAITRLLSVVKNRGIERF